MLGVGAALMPIASISGSVPIAELVLSGCFSVLVGGYVLIDDRDKTMSYYFGLILGVLGSVVLAGLPHL
jgi:peptidoglycan/LPS O-acetylase OafA/YrhL